MTAVDGDIEIVGENLANDGLRGVTISVQSLVNTTGDGNIDVIGDSSGDEPGVLVELAAAIRAEGSGSVFVQGDNNGGGDGVSLLDLAEVTSTSGLIEVIGFSSGSDGVGVRVSDSTVQSDSGDITIDGDGDDAGDGVLMTSGATVASATGALLILGASVDNDAIDIDGGSTLTTAGNIDIIGDAGSGGDDGVQIGGAGTRVASTGGVITIDGTSADDDGVLIEDDAEIENTGSGNIFILGFGAGDGIEIDDGVTISAEDGLLDIFGSASGDDGVEIKGSSLTTTGGAISLVGDTISASSTAEGVRVSDSQVSTMSGEITVSGLSDGDDGFDMDTGASLQTVFGDIFIDGNGADDGIDLDDASITTTDGLVTLIGLGDEMGVELTSGSVIEALGAGDIQISGESLGASNLDDGLFMDGVGTTISAQDGDITILVTSANGAGLNMVDPTSITSSNGNVDINSTQGDVLLSGVSGVDVAITAVMGSILDNGDTHPDVFRRVGHVDGVGSCRPSGDDRQRPARHRG